MYIYTPILTGKCDDKGKIAKAEEKLGRFNLTSSHMELPWVLSKDQLKLAQQHVS